MDKDVFYVDNRGLLSHKNNQIFPCVITWMDLSGIIPSEISQAE